MHCACHQRVAILEGAAVGYDALHITQRARIGRRLALHADAAIVPLQGTCHKRLDSLMHACTVDTFTGSCVHVFWLVPKPVPLT